MGLSTGPPLPILDPALKSELPLVIVIPRETLKIIAVNTIAIICAPQSKTMYCPFESRKYVIMYAMTVADHMAADSITRARAALAEERKSVCRYGDSRLVEMVGREVGELFMGTET